MDKYYNPLQFLENISQYDKDVKICIDNDFGNAISGLEIAKQLHANGYRNLYLVSGKSFNKEEVPDYLVTILKTDSDKLMHI